MKITIHPLFQTLLDAMPEEYRDEKTGSERKSAEYCELNSCATAGLNIYDEGPESVYLLLKTVPGQEPSRTRTYKVRKDGTLNVKRIIEVVVDTTKAVRAVHVARAEARRKSDERIRQSRKDGEKAVEILFLALKPSKAYTIQKEPGIAGGVMIHPTNGGGGQPVWLQKDSTLIGNLPLDGLSIATLNKVMKLIGEEN